MRSCIAQFGMIWKDHSTMRLSDITGCDKASLYQWQKNRRRAPLRILLQGFASV